MKGWLPRWLFEKIMVGEVLFFLNMVQETINKANAVAEEERKQGKKQD
jgi:hypothetical protein